jgi:hypothetical protein
MAKKHIIISGSDLEVLCAILGQEKSVPQSDWDIWPDKDNPKAAWCYVFGCPNGNGGYLQCLFGADQSLLEAKIIDPGGVICECKWCKPAPEPKKVRKHARNRRHGRGSRSVRK